MAGPMTRTPMDWDAPRMCLLCGAALPPLPWWRRNWLLEAPPFHDPGGPDGPQCWRGLCLALGLGPDVPMPDSVTIQRVWPWQRWMAPRP